jgi:hypothetical protein
MLPGPRAVRRPARVPVLRRHGPPRRRAHPARLRRARGAHAPRSCSCASSAARGHGPHAPRHHRHPLGRLARRPLGPATSVRVCELHDGATRLRQLDEPALRKWMDRLPRRRPAAQRGPPRRASDRPRVRRARAE